MRSSTSADEQGSLVSADGTEIAYRRDGDGEPLVFVHGNGGEPWNRGPFVPHLAEEFETVVPERRGWGPSDRGPDHALDRHVEDVRAVLDVVDDDPVLFGQSFGGLCALEAARTGSVERLILYEPAILVGEHREANAAAEIDALIEAGDPEAAVELALSESADVEDVESLPFWPGIVDQAEVIRDEFRVVEEYRLADDFAIDVPTLVLTGERSPAFLRDAARAVHDAIPESRLVELEGVGHTGAEAPDRVASAVRSFVRES